MLFLWVGRVYCIQIKNYFRTYMKTEYRKTFKYLSRRLERLTSKHLYAIFIYNMKQKITFETNILQSLNLESICWKKVYVLASKVTIDNYSRQFHFKITHNILYLNKSLYRMGLSITQFCPFCKTWKKTVVHLFHDCLVVKSLWNNLSNFLLPNLVLPPLTPESAILVFFYIDSKLDNQINLMFKIAIYNSRIKETCSLELIKDKLKAIKRLEDNITFLDEKRKLINQSKWAIILSELT